MGVFGQISVPVQDVVSKSPQVTRRPRIWPSCGFKMLAQAGSGYTPDNHTGF